MYRLRNLCREVSKEDHFINEINKNPVQLPAFADSARGFAFCENFRVRKSGGVKLYGIILVDSGTARNRSVIGDKNGFHAIGLFHQLHSLF